MEPITIDRARNDDPRRLREHLAKLSGLAADHRLTSVVVGLAGTEGDLIFPEIVDYLESALRMDDAIVRMTRERSVLFLTDVDRRRAEEIIGRLLSGFREHFPTAAEPTVALGFFEVGPGAGVLTVKEVLPALFAPVPCDEAGPAAPPGGVAPPGAGGRAPVTGLR